MPEPLAFACALDQAGNVGDREPGVAGLHHSEVGDERGERVVGDLGPGRGHRRDEARFAGRGKTDQRDVGDRLELEDDVPLVTRDAEQGEPGGLALLRGQRRVTEATLASGRGDEFRSFTHEVREDLTVLRLDDGAVGYGEDQRLAGLAAAPVAHPVAAVGGVAVGCVVVVEQRGGLAADAQDHVAAVAAVAAVGPTEGLELLTLDGHAAVTARTAGNVQDYPVNEAGHVDLLLKCFICRMGPA